MANLHTRDGKPLRRTGEDVHDNSGRHVGKIDGDKVYGANGRYVATLVGDRLVYRQIDSAGISSPFVPKQSTALGGAQVGGSGLWGDEPSFS
ncbi:hypothetical protein OHA84_00875 [Streptomyces sp. NBC_00513]|uniref:hypothetical protein n=1 Tax=unclassified Streptomyces TaxID=2593676 RepID=UPI00225634D1|nr:hypothetical protein [Streptomyces sp. NBC_00424]MCX5079266.1 hypothetical protein [Streptomyces sp. NBC_00424]WUD39172.1 hypothetical protein OHA84_00875 [Streptomyces sp. NBC_00513]